MNNTPQLAIALQETGDALTVLGRLMIAGDRMTGLDWGHAAMLLESAALRIRKTHAPGCGAVMGSKINPGNYDCEAEALPDEPRFTLLARDDSAPQIVEAWAATREAAIARNERPAEDAPKVAEARALAAAMPEWRKNRFAAWRKEPDVEAV